MPDSSNQAFSEFIKNWDFNTSAPKLSGESSSTTQTSDSATDKP